MTLYFLISIAVFITLCYCIRKFSNQIYKVAGTAFDESIDKFIAIIVLVIFSVSWAVTIPVTILIILIYLLGNFIFKNPRS